MTIENEEILVTGGCGFIGTHIAKSLMQKNEVTILDNFLTGKLQNLKFLRKFGKARFVKGSVRDFNLVRRLIEGKDRVLHFAAVVGVEQATQKPIDVLDTELIGTSNILRCCLETDCQKVLYASSSEVYGESEGVACKEEMTAAPRSVYGVAKLACELYCRSYFTEYGLNTVSIRYFNVYGPLQDERFVISRFIRNVLKRRSPTVYFDGLQTRDFTYIDDVVEGSLLALEKEELSGRTLNIGTGIPTTIKSLAEKVIDLCGMKEEVEIEFRPPLQTRSEEFEIKNRQTDVSLMKEFLGYDPPTSLEDGLRKTIDWYKNKDSIGM
jgi:nucleoside-diphosphate-sugar epimerase